MANPDEATAGAKGESVAHSGRLESRPSIGVRGGYFWPACALLTALYLTVALYRSSDMAFIAPDEPRYAGAGRTMAQGGSLLLPHFNGEARINKPPLFYWLVALSDRLCGGASETSARLPSVVMGLLMLWGTLWLGRRIFGRMTALLAGAVLISTPLFIALSRVCITDMTLSTFMAGSLGFMLLAVCGFAPGRRSGWIAAILLGTAVLTKATTALAPVVFAVAIARALELPRSARPALARWLPWMLAAALVFSAVALQAGMKRRHAPRNEKTPAAARADSGESAENTGDEAAPVKGSMLDLVLNPIALALAIGAALLVFTMAYRAERLAPALPRMWIAGLLAAILMGLWWYILMFASQGLARFQALLDFEFKQRLVGAMHREAMHYFLWMLPALTFPWSLGLPGVLACAWPRSCGAGGPPAPDSDERAADPRRRADVFLLAWIAGIVFFFSIPGAKLPTYLMPALPAFALLTARFLMRLWQERQAINRRWVVAIQALAAIAAVALLMLPLFAEKLAKDTSSFSGALLASKQLLWPTAIGAAILFPGAWLLALRGFARSATLVLCATAIALILLAAQPAIEGLNARSMKSVSARIRGDVADCATIVSLGVAPESLTYYLDHTIIEAHSKRAGGEQGVEFVTKLFSEMKLPANEGWALFIDRRYYLRIFGGKEAAQAITPENIAAKLPQNSVFEFVYANENMLVVRNKVKR